MKDDFCARMLNLTALETEGSADGLALLLELSTFKDAPAGDEHARLIRAQRRLKEVSADVAAVAEAIEPDEDDEDHDERERLSRCTATDFDWTRWGPRNRRRP